ncbi:hypothetical protein [Halorubellus salinus]|uniref:hypothetical protein n=1 Tax=Halorubellus salinus TaxID=755309 RepID=UPI001D092F81|nr:hypothetical protein [Halorubellus salinus]
MGRLSDAATTVLGLPRRIGRDLVQMKDGLREFIGEGVLVGKLADLLYSTTLGAAIDALGAEDPDDQITGSVIMISWSIGTSIFTGGFTLLFVLVWGFFLAMGVFRYSDDGERAWDNHAPDIDVDIPGTGLRSKPKQYTTRSRRGGED